MLLFLLSLCHDSLLLTQLIITKHFDLIFGYDLELIKNIFLDNNQ